MMPCYNPRIVIRRSLIAFTLATTLGLMGCGGGGGGAAAFALSPQSATIQVQRDLFLQVQGNVPPFTTITWAVREPGGGTVAPQGGGQGPTSAIYTAPNTTGVFHVDCTIDTPADPPRVA